VALAPVRARKKRIGPLMAYDASEVGHICKWEGGTYQRVLNMQLAFRPITRLAAAVGTVVCLGCAAQAQVPVVNVQATCKAASAVTLGLSGNTNSQNDINICLDSENRARQQLAKDWSTYVAADRTECIQTDVYLPSYIEWLTCLEMNRSVRQMRGGDSMKAPTNPDGSVTMPPLASLGVSIRSSILGP
jgi:hypothetical protein